MRFSASYVSFALVLITSVAAHPLPFEDGLDNSVAARQESFETRSLFDKRGKGQSKEEVTDKDRKDGKPPKYKDAKKKQPPKYEPGGHQQLDFHSEHDPDAGRNRKDGSSGGGGSSSHATHAREFEEYLESRGLFDKKGKGKADEEVTDKERKDGKPPKYKDIKKKQPPKYEPGGHQQLDFHSEHDPDAGRNRKDGSSGGGGSSSHATHARDFIEEFLESRSLLDKRGKGQSKEVTDKDRKDGKPPKYKDAKKKQPPKYEPGGEQQLDFHSEHDPDAGRNRKDGSSGGGGGSSSHATHARDLVEAYLQSRGLFDKKGKGKANEEVTDKERKDGKPPKYKDVKKKQPPKYEPGGQQQLDFHSEHDPDAGRNRKDGSSGGGGGSSSHATHVRDLLEEYLNTRGLFRMDVDLD